MRCPDCSGAGRNLEHDPMCPLAIGMDAVVDADRDWFLAHPNATERHRPISDAELREFGISGLRDAEHMTCVHVVQLAPGYRTRRPYSPLPAEAS